MAKSFPSWRAGELGEIEVAEVVMAGASSGRAGVREKILEPCHGNCNREIVVGIAGRAGCGWQEPMPVAAGFSSRITVPR